MSAMELGAAGLGSVCGWWAAAYPLRPRNVAILGIGTVLWLAALASIIGPQSWGPALGSAGAAALARGVWRQQLAARFPASAPGSEDLS